MATKAIKNETKKDFFILRMLVTRDLKIKYRRSVLGILWSVLNPLLMMVVLTVVFSTLFRFNIEYFPVYLILGNTIFAFMTDATTGSLRSILDAAPLIKKIRISKVIFPLEKCTFAMINFLFQFIAVACVMIYFRIAPTINMLLLPVLLLCVFLFSLGLALLLSSLVLFFRDIEHLWSVLVSAWTYATPLFYPVEILPSWAVPIMHANPMYYFVTYFRQIMLWNQTPSIKMTLGCLAIGLLTFLIGLFVFKKLEKKFILYV